MSKTDTQRIESEAVSITNLMNEAEQKHSVEATEKLRDAVNAVPKQDQVAVFEKVKELDRQAAEDDIRRIAGFVREHGTFGGDGQEKRLEKDIKVLGDFAKFQKLFDKELQGKYHINPVLNVGSVDPTWDIELLKGKPNTSQSTAPIDHLTLRADQNIGLASLRLY